MAPTLHPFGKRKHRCSGLGTSKRLHSGGSGIIPWSVGLALGLLLLHYAHLAVLRNILSGIAATAAGLLVATGARLLLPHRDRPIALLFAALAFGLITFGRLPLLAVLFTLVPISIVVASFESARAR